MISAVVFTPDSWPGDDLAQERETVVRSLVWLVSAVVSSVVRDVILAVPAGLGLGEVADQSGCTLVQADTEADRIASALAAAREPRVILVKAGFQPDAGLVEELDSFTRREPEGVPALLLAAPATTYQRLFPQRSAAAGVLLTRAFAGPGGRGFDRLVRLARRQGAMRLQCAARPIFGAR